MPNGIPASKIFAVAYLLPELFYIPTESYKDYIRDKKCSLICKVMEDYPATIYDAVCFDLEENKGRVYEAIENHFKTADGRYIYKGNFVSREFLEKRFENYPFRIKLTVYVRKENLENA